MAFSLGSIFVELTCNTAKFLSGMDKASVAAKKTGRDIRTGLGEVGGALANLGAVGKQVGGVLEGLGSKAAQAFDVAASKGRGLGTLMLGSMLGGATALAGGMFALADHAAAVGSKIFEASEKTGIGAAQMSGLMAIAKETGGDFDSLTTSLARAGVNLEKAIIQPGTDSAKVLKQVMAGAFDASGKGLKPMGDALQVVLKNIYALHTPAEREVELQALLGKGWMQNVSTLKLLAEQGYGPAEAAARRFGIFFDDNAARQARQFSIAMSEIKAELSGLGLAIGESVIPKLTGLITSMVGTLPTMKEFGLRMLAIQAAMTGVGIPLAIKMWKDADAQGAKSQQSMTDFLTRIQSLTAGEKANGDETGKLTSGLKAHADVLAKLILREQEQLDLLNAGSNEAAKLGVEYRHTVDEIQKAVAAGGSYAESLKAQGLALDIYQKKLMEIKPVLPKMPKLFPKAVAPTLEVPQRMPSAIGGPSPFIAQTLAQLAKLPLGLDATRTEEKALREETQLSFTAFAKLAAVFPRLTEAELAALPAGQRMIEQLAKMDKLGSLSDRFKEMTDSLITTGDNFSGKLFATIGGTIDQLESKFAELAVKGKANFREILPAMEEAIVKAGLQKGVSVLTSGIGGLFGQHGSTKADGSQGSPFYTILTNAVHSLIGGPAGEGIAGNGDSSELHQIASQMQGAFGSLAKSLGGLFGKFGGFLAGGGDVTPGRAYVVGEKHPEWFMPKASGSIVPSLGAQGSRPIVYSPVYNINTPDADSFRRSQGAVMADGYKQMALVHARNS